MGFDQLSILPNPVKVATEGALWAAVIEQGLIKGTVTVCLDGAGQFRLTDHAVCWIHAERLVYKLQPTNLAQRRAVDLIRTALPM